MFLSEITHTEFTSAIWKKIRKKEANEEAGNKLIEMFESDEFEYQWILIDSVIIKKSVNLLKKYGRNGLRTFDSLQLASVIQLKNNIADEIICFVSDKILHAAMTQEGFRVI